MDYDIGYGKPPTETRFKAGTSGNPKGRPKGSLNLATALNRALKENVIVTEGGRKKKMTKLDVLIKGLINRAVKGDPRAVQQMLSLGPLVGIESTTSSHLPEADALIIQNMLDRLNAEGKGIGV